MRRRGGGRSPRLGRLSVPAATGNGLVAPIGVRAVAAATEAMGAVRSFIAEAISAALWNLSVGSFSIARRITPSSAGGTEGSRDVGGITASWTCLNATASGSAASNG